MSAERVRVHGDLYHGEVPDGAIYVGRAAPGLKASPYHNRHRVGGACRTCGRTHDRAESVTTYAQDLTADPELIERVRQDLRGADLACWCPLDGPCHGDVLIRVADGADPLDAVATVLREKDDAAAMIHEKGDAAAAGHEKETATARTREPDATTERSAARGRKKR
ncbi:DUF4326 domain-containing protein [Actinoplanes regularis]|uniref:DUF4326 domain-containing protein n=1 Tax=Actinoplanes regularis TaxID=52697 RepID=UPI0024A556FD|nr:DUF4326 domain-containing protein [Actinoplanes regularis]GLW34609.1 hypothetical protein Areg01_75460 [Actinoplanes regularis]